jgi:hypothetical protein
MPHAVLRVTAGLPGYHGDASTACFLHPLARLFSSVQFFAGTNGWVLGSSCRGLADDAWAFAICSACAAATFLLVGHAVLSLLSAFFCGNVTASRVLYATCTATGYRRCRPYTPRLRLVPGCGLRFWFLVLRDGCYHACRGKLVYLVYRW